MDHLTTNVVTIAIETAAVIVLVWLLSWICCRALRLVSAGRSAVDRGGGTDPLGKAVRRFMFLLGSLACLMVIGTNGYYAWRGENLPEFTLERLREVPDSFWIDLAIGAGKVAGLCVAAAIVLRIARGLLRRACAAAKAYEGIRANNDSIESFFAALTRVVSRGSWLGVLVLSSALLATPQAVQDGTLLLLEIYLTVAIGLVALRAIDAVIASIDALSNKYARSKDLLKYYDNLKPLMPALRRSIEWIVYVAIATTVLTLVETEALAVWGPRFVRVIGIAFLGRVVIAVVTLLLEELLLLRPKLDDAQRQRRATLVPLFRSVLGYGIWFAVGVMILKEVQFDPTPVLAGAGILALAVGLGAQNLINDMVSGLFILFENHFLVGDVVKINEAEGVVEAIELRTTRVRDARGRIHIVRNGSIDGLVNYSKEYTLAAVEVGVAYESDLEAVFAALTEVGSRTAERSPDVLAATVVQGVQAFGESELLIRTVTKVKPGRHAQVERDLRRNIKEVFDERGIEIPYPRRVVISRGEAPAA